MSSFDPHGTTIVCVRRNGRVAMGGDGQVTLGNTVMKGNARKVRRLHEGRVIAGFAGGTADAFTLFERFEAKLQQFGNLTRAAIELAKDWRSDRSLRRLEALLCVADATNLRLTIRLVLELKATGRQQLVIAGVVTEVCVAFPALSAIEEGFEVFVVTDASGTFNALTRDSAWARMSAAGVQLMSWFGVACELHRDWRNDVEGLGSLFARHIPDYRNLMVSYAQHTK